MFNFIKEAMSPTTRSSIKQQEDEKQESSSLVDLTSGAPAVVPAKPIKGYKITDNERSRKYGIGCNSLQMLKAKAKQKFPVSIFSIMYIGFIAFLRSSHLMAVDSDWIGGDLGNMYISP